MTPQIFATKKKDRDVLRSRLRTDTIPRNLYSSTSTRRAVARLKRGTAQSFKILNLARIVINLSW